MTYRVVPCPKCSRLHGVIAVRANHKPVAAPAPASAIPTPALSNRFWSKVDQSAGPDACWPWLGAKSGDGYGHMAVGTKPNQRMVRAHRLALTLTGVVIEEGLWALHRCDNPPCVNPAHLFVGTPADNSRDRDAKGRSALSVRNPRAKLTPDDVRHIRVLVQTASVASVAKSYGVSLSAVKAIAAGRSWAHIGTPEPVRRGPSEPFTGPWVSPLRQASISRSAAGASGSHSRRGGVPPTRLGG